MKIHTTAVDGGPFNNHPAREWELEPNRIACNEITLPGEERAGAARLWLISNEYGAVCATWGRHEQEALDVMIDEDLGQSFLISEDDQKKATDDERNSWTHLGNAGKPANLDHANIAPVNFDKVRDFALIMAFAECRGSRSKTLED